MGKLMSIVSKKEGRRIAFVEVQNPIVLSVEDVTNLRIDVLTEFNSIPVYFLVVSQDQGYLWTDTAGLSDEPTYHFPMHSVIKSYFKSHDQKKRLSNDVLGRIIYQWLHIVEWGLQDDPYTVEAEKILYESGLIEKMHKAELNWEDDEI